MLKFKIFGIEVHKDPLVGWFVITKKKRKELEQAVGRMRNETEFQKAAWRGTMRLLRKRNWWG